MKKKKLILTLLFLLCISFALPATASAYKNEWVTTGDGTYYYGNNGKKYTGGPKKIKSGKKTYLYLFDRSGKLITDQVTKYKKKLYLSLANGRLLTTFKQINGAYYYGTEKGYLKTGKQTYKKKIYYFNPKNGQALKKQWKKIGKYYYYFNGRGRAYHGGVYTINGKKYYFDKSGRRSSGVYKIGKYYYGFNSKGVMVTGWRTLDKNKYYFQKNGRAYVNGFHKINKKSYYFNSYGVRQTGWLVIGNKRYYLDPNDNGARIYGTKKINGTTYKFGSKGYVTYKPTGNLTIHVNRKKCVITIYDGSTPVKAMACSVGRAGSPTPTGTFFIRAKYRWWELNGPSYGQYCSKFLDAYLFHSVPMYGTTRNPYNVNASDYNRLGSPASEGCIRLCVADARWIYDNVPVGSTIVISDHEKTPLGKPTPMKMKAGTTGKDPTDVWS